MAKESTKSFVLRIDARTMEALEVWAADEFRSINGQLQWIIADALQRNRRTPKEKIPKAEVQKDTADSPRESPKSQSWPKDNN